MVIKPMYDNEVKTMIIISSVASAAVAVVHSTTNIFFALAWMVNRTKT